VSKMALLQLNSSNMTNQQSPNASSKNKINKDESFLTHLNNINKQNDENDELEKERIEGAKSEEFDDELGPKLNGLKLNEEEIEELKELLSKNDIELSTKELKGLLESIGSLYQQLMNLKVNHLSYENSFSPKDFKTLKNDLSKLIMNLSNQINNLEGSNFKNLKDFKVKTLQQILEKLVKVEQPLKDLLNKNQNSKKALQFFNSLKSTKRKLNKLLKKYGISGKEVELTKESNQINSENKETSNNQKLKSNNSKTGNNSGELNKHSNSKSQNKKEGQVNKQNQVNKRSVSTNDSLENKSKVKDNKAKFMNLNNKGKNQDLKTGIKMELNRDNPKLKSTMLEENKVNVEEQVGLKQRVLNQTTFNTNSIFNRVDQTKIINQINRQLEQMQSLGKNQLTLKLEPEFLGKLNLKLVMNEGIMTAKLMAENNQVKKIIEAQLPRLKSSLAEKNIELGEVVVDVGAEDNFSSSQRQQQFNQQQGFSRQRQDTNSLDIDSIPLNEAKEIQNLMENRSIGSDSIDYVI